VTHVDDAVLASVRERFGTPAELRWEGEISQPEWSVATYNPSRTHDVTLFILDPSRRLALIRKPQFTAGVWRPPGGGIKPGEDFVAGAVREALEETGLRVELRRYLVASSAVFRHAGRELAWRTHVLLGETEDEELAPDDPAEIAAARWGTHEELAGPLRERLLATGRAFWRYRVALHDAALAAMAPDLVAGHGHRART
jgi:8-oxo-dGTP diphosphatase